MDPGFVAASGAPAARVVASYDGPLAQGLKETSAWFAPGMTAEGPTYTATLAEKGHAKTDVTLRGGRCYVVVGFSRDGQVIDFDLRVWRVPKGTLLGEDFDDDTTPTIGKPPICLDTDAPVLVELFADKGKGDVAVQVYSKPR